MVLSWLRMRHSSSRISVSVSSTGFLSGYLEGQATDAELGLADLEACP
jgi:hypothetical protein